MGANVRMHRVPTGQIEVGDVVLEHGMRVRIDEIRTYPNDGSNRDQYPVVYACLGTVLNLAEVRAARIVPRSFLYDAERDRLGPGHGREDYWNVQGNDLATWTVVRELHRYRASRKAALAAR